jgi:periplasmic divalent cation tolerance protein
MYQALIVMTTVPTLETAQQLAEVLVRRRFAACVNIMPAMTSVYEWKGKLETGQEHMLMIKTRSGRYRDVEAEILNIHPYELPEILTISIQSGLSSYLHWLFAQTSATTKE